MYNGRAHQLSNGDERAKSNFELWSNECVIAFISVGYITVLRIISFISIEIPFA